MALHAIKSFGMRRVHCTPRETLSNQEALSAFHLCQQRGDSPAREERVQQLVMNMHYCKDLIGAPLECDQQCKTVPD